MRPTLIVLTSLAFLLSGCTMEDEPWGEDTDGEFLESQPPDRPAHGDDWGPAGVASGGPLPDTDFWDTDPTPNDWFPAQVDTDYQHPFESPGEDVMLIQ